MSLRRLPPTAQHEQRGVATVFAAITILILITLLTFHSSRVLTMDHRTATNQVRQQHAFEAAQYGMERAVAWLQARSTAPYLTNWSSSSTSTCKTVTTPGTNDPYSIYALAWTTPAVVGGQATRYLDPNAECNKGIPGSVANPLTVTANSLSYTVTVEFTQTISSTDSLKYLIVRSTAVASSDTTVGGKSVIQQTVSIPGGPAGSASTVTTPIVVKGCLSGVTGNPDICPSNVSASNANITGAGGTEDCAIGTGTTGVAVTTLQNQPTNPDSCLNMGHFAEHGGTRQFLGTPSATVWETLFPGGNLTEQMVKTASQAGSPAFKYYDSSSAPAKIPAQGSASQQVIIYVDSAAGCIPLAPGDFYAIVYYESGSSCDLQGGGAVNLYGMIATEGSISKFNANTIVRHSGATGTNEKNVTEGANVFTRVPGTWDVIGDIAQ